MKDCKDGQHPPYPDSHNNASLSCETGNSRARLSGAISPPPLKRQRTLPEYPKPYPRNHVTNPDISRDNSSEHTASLVKEWSERDRGADPSRKSCPLPAPPAPSGYKQRQSNNTSLNSRVRRSDVSAKAVRSSKHACRVCERSSSTTYNPLIVCGGCSRPYHDSCRKPPLIKGADPQQWRCSACLNSTVVSKGFRVPPTLAPTRRSAVRDIFRPNAQKSLNLVPSGLSKDVPFVNAVSVQISHANNSDESVHDKHHLGISESEKIQGLSERPTTELLKRTETARTPTQCVSQTELPDNTRRGHVQHNVENHVGTSVVDAHPQLAKHTFLKSPCSICRDGTDAVECPSCCKKSLMAESEKLEISKTPDTLPIRSAPTHAEVTHVAARTSSFVPATQSAPTPVAHADLVTSRPDAGKTDDDQRSCTTTGSQEALMRVKARIEVPHIDGVMEPNIVREVDHMKQLSTRVPNRQDGENPGAPADTSPSLEEGWSSQLASPSHHNINGLSESCIPTEISRSIEINSSTVDTSKAKQPSATSTDPKGLKDQDNQSFLSPKALVNSTLEGMVASTLEKRYTMRELARIALVGANGTRLTALQIIDWLAQKFSYLQKGEGTWEKNVKSALSGFEEFNGRKTAGSAKLYGFANEQFRAQFEQKYQTHCTRPESVGHQLVDISKHEQCEPIIQPTHGPESAAKRLKVTHASPLRISVVSSPTKSDVSLIPQSLAPIETSSNNGPLRIPFVRTTTRDSENTLEEISDTKREMNFRTLRLQLQKQSIESMTSDEKARKIAQIQARPSRKTFFGADHRLAHVRRYRRQDIHDERDGAWQPSITNQRKDKRTGDDEIGDIRTLREVFNLPANAIPMNDGQNELAFRDGTLINGRLPRSRHIYRAGKLFGGELTTRLS